MGKVFADSKNPESDKKLYDAWTGNGKRQPPGDSYQGKILEVLFDGEPQFEIWVHDLEDARKRSRGAGNNVRNIKLDDAHIELNRAGFRLQGPQNSDLDSDGQKTFPVGHLQLHKFKAEPTNLNELLRTDLRATTLAGRTDELAMLSDWLSSPSAIAVKCIIGGAGAGKTRLAIEACEAAEATGWFAAFLPSRELLAMDGKRQLLDWTPSQPTLLIIDYAATSVGALKHWFDELALLADRPASELRILLLERHADRENGWWASLTRPDSNTHATSADLIGGEIPYILPPLDDVGDRRALLAEVMAKAAPLFDPPRTPIMPPELGEDPWFDQRLSDNGLDTEPLYLAMAGICAADSGVSSALATNRLGLAHRIASIEQERLQAFAMARGFTDGGKLLQHIAACTTLQNGCDPSALPSLIKKERLAMGMASSFDDEAVAAILCDFLPMATKVEPVRPDLIGESFCLAVVDGGPFRADRTRKEIVLRCWERDPAGAIDTMIRCACDFGEGNTSHPSLIYLGGIVENCNNIADLFDIAAAIPFDTLILRELSVDIYFDVIRLLKPMVAAKPEVYTSGLATVLTNFSIRLGYLGRFKEAFAAVEEAVALWRQLAAARPDAVAPELVRALHNFSIRLGDLGHRDEALATAEEALVLARQITSAHPDAFMPDLARSIDNFAIRLSDLGRRNEAFAAADEALVLWRQLASARPAAFASSLAGALHNFANRLGDLGRRDEALAAVEDALVLCRQLATAHPDAFMPDLASTLDNFANRLSHVGRRDEALEAAEEALTLWRHLASGYPDAFISDLASTLLNFANRLGDLDRRDEALAAGGEALTLWRQLATTRSGTCAPQLAGALHNFSIRLSDLGRRKEALAAAGEALALWRQLASAHPDAFMPNLADALHNSSIRLSDLGQQADALMAAEEALVLRRQLATVNPDAFTPGLAQLLSLLGDIMEDSNRIHDALSYDHEAILTLFPYLSVNKTDLENSMQIYAHSYIRRSRIACLEKDQLLLERISKYVDITSI